ncbi:hypothetical protein [Altericista sp. CCNU0014]|uniref:hypothetical protein n=1 Tax=Altericista sp. CCNU0014 TaxID=3082949 RepID=UPI00384DD2F0
MHTSFAYGLLIQSELPLAQPVLDAGTPDIVVRFGSLGQAVTEPERGNRISIDLPLGVKLLIRDGCEVTIDAPAETDRAVLRAYVLGAAMAFVLRQRGALVLHASCVARGDEAAIAFLGGSGWGKSTLASAFHRQGYRLITDDVMAIGLDASSPQVIPSFPEVKLLPDAMAAIGSGSDELQLHSLSHKQIQRLESRFDRGPVPLKHLFVLQAGEVNRIHPLPRAKAFPELIQHSRATKILTDPTFRLQHFHQCSCLAKAVPMAYLQRPRSLEQLPQLIDFIESYLTNLTNL